MKKRVLVVDNYDSFTWNLVQLVGALGGAPEVVRNDEVTLADVEKMDPTHIILSPGPGHPDDARRIGVCRPILEKLERVPVLGVCLGHQAIVRSFGGRVVEGEPVHGKTAEIEHEGDGLLADLPRPFTAMRYHSLVADRESLPSSLVANAWCKDGTIMGVRHRERPVHGVQFHPESIGTPIGKRLVGAFLLLGAIAACGGAEGSKAPPQAPSPAATTAPEREPESIAEAQEQIEHAKSDLSFSEKDNDSASSSAAKPRGTTGTAPSEESATGAGNSCVSSCRAISSMRRAVTALCRMTGDEDTRCADAKKTLSKSESSVARCHCGP